MYLKRILNTDHKTSLITRREVILRKEILVTNHKRILNEDIPHKDILSYHKTILNSYRKVILRKEILVQSYQKILQKKIPHKDIRANHHVVHFLVVVVGVVVGEVS